MLRLQDLANKSFLDAGCGSGLFSLAALELGAARVVSFDVDQDSVGCAKVLNERYGPFANWEITQGSILDRDWLKKLGTFDVVYSWGVLHHTGAMWKAIENICDLVSPGGNLYISIYNDQGVISRIWLIIKKIYNRSPAFVKFLMASAYYVIALAVECISICVQQKPYSEWFGKSQRGMSLWYDCVDWCGGYPYETAKAEELFEYIYSKGFNLVNMKLKKGSGCNELAFIRNA